MISRISAVTMAIAVLLFFLPAWQSARCQEFIPGKWETNGPTFNAEVTSLIVDPAERLNILVGTRGLSQNVLTGLFRSDNGGIDWVAACCPQ